MCPCLLLQIHLPRQNPLALSMMSLLQPAHPLGLVNNVPNGVFFCQWRFLLLVGMMIFHVCDDTIDDWFSVFSFESRPALFFHLLIIYSL